MKYQFHLLMILLMLSIAPTFISCDKDEPIGPGKEVDRYDIFLQL
jgi:hypothetical protein